MTEPFETKNIAVGVVGLGLMGTSIVTTFLLAGHSVKAIAPLPEDMAQAPDHIHHQLSHCQESGLLSRPMKSYLAQLTITQDYSQLSDCSLVLECVIENLAIKAKVYEKIAAEITDDTIIASNTSAIPISQLQEHVPHPKRFLGIHWGEPAYLSRFLEIICGDQTDLAYAEWAREIAPHWGKEPTLLRKDIRGFVTNRLMYAVYREALTLIEEGEATLEDADKAFRYDAGSWITLMGLFRRMDFEGLQDYSTIFKNIFPKLTNRETVPTFMQQLVAERARGTQTARGLYSYTPEEARQWDQAFESFNLNIYNLARKYPADAAKNLTDTD